MLAGRHLSAISQALPRAGNEGARQGQVGADRRLGASARTGVYMKIAGILLIVAGMAAILFGGFSYKSHIRIPGADLVMISATQDHPVRFPPMLGIAAILAGSGLMFLRIQRG